MDIEWSYEKNEILKQTRNICFEDVEFIINSDEVIDIKQHPNLEKYPNQMLLIVFLNDYTYYVPFVKTDNGFFLKNIIPSRKYHKIYASED